MAGGFLVPAAQATVPARDRGLLLGDGLFETIRIVDGRAPLLVQHLHRLATGCGLLRMPAPPADLADALDALIRTNHGEVGFARITVTRGSGQRGYEPPAAAEPLIIIDVGPWHAPDRPFTVCLAEHPILPHPILRKIKHTSALPRVFLRDEARRRGAQEALLVNTGEYLVEGVATNLFWVRQNVVYTPDLAQGGLPGVARDFVLSAGAVTQGAFKPGVLAQADEVFLTNALMGPIGVATLIRGEAPRQWPAPGPITVKLQQAWRRHLGIAGGD